MVIYCSLIRSLVITLSIAYANIDEIKRPAQSWHQRKFQIRKSFKFEMVTLNNHFFLFSSSWLHYVWSDFAKILLNINAFNYILFQQKFFTVCIRLFDSIKFWHNCYMKLKKLLMPSFVFSFGACYCFSFQLKVHCVDK